MGQRLIVHFYNCDEEEIANVYFHWSAYTNSALEIMKELFFIMRDNKENFKLLNDYEKILLLIDNYDIGYGRIGISGYNDNIDISFINSKLEDKYPKIKKLRTCVNRNVGIISFEPEGIMDSNNWEEGTIDINLDNGLFYFGVFRTIDLEEIKENNFQTPPIYDQTFKNITEDDICLVNAYDSDEEVSKFFNIWGKAIENQYCIPLYNGEGDNYVAFY